jgi:hypothetical protein
MSSNSNPDFRSVYVLVSSLVGAIVSMAVAWVATAHSVTTLVA